MSFGHFFGIDSDAVVHMEPRFVYQWRRRGIAANESSSYRPTASSDGNILICIKPVRAAAVAEPCEPSGIVVRSRVGSDGASLCYPTVPQRHNARNLFLQHYQCCRIKGNKIIRFLKVLHSHLQTACIATSRILGQSSIKKCQWQQKQQVFCHCSNTFSYRRILKPLLQDKAEQWVIRKIAELVRTRMISNARQEAQQFLPFKPFAESNRRRFTYYSLKRVFANGQQLLLHL